MASTSARLVTEAALTATAPGVIREAATGRVALTLPGGGTVELGTTGDRNITTLCTNLAAGTVEIMRTGYTCMMTLSGVKVAGGNNISILPADTAGFIYRWFRPGVYEGASTKLDKGNAKLVIGRNGDVNVQFATSTDVLAGTLTWLTQRSWPTEPVGAEGPIG